MQAHRLLLRRLGAVAAAAAALLLVIAGCALAGSRPQPNSQPVTVAAATGSQNTLDQGSSDAGAVGSDPRAAWCRVAAHHP